MRVILLSFRNSGRSISTTVIAISLIGHCERSEAICHDKGALSLSVVANVITQSVLLLVNANGIPYLSLRVERSNPSRQMCSLYTVRHIRFARSRRLYYFVIAISPVGHCERSEAIRHDQCAPYLSLRIRLLTDEAICFDQCEPPEQFALSFTSFVPREDGLF